MKPLSYEWICKRIRELHTEVVECQFGGQLLIADIKIRDIKFYKRVLNSVYATHSAAPAAEHDNVVQLRR